jgi:hypothetical protein
MPNVMCSSCGAKVPLPEGHTRAKIRCGLCGYYAEVPSELRASDSDEPRQSPAGPPLTPNPSPPRGEGNKGKTPKGEGNKSRRAKPNTNAADPRPNFESDVPTGPNLLDGDDIERDGLEATPYSVPGTGLKKCPDCRGDLPLDATLCVHCGVEFGTRTKKAKREYTPLFREWEAYLPFDLRLKIFFGLQALNVVFAVLSLVFKQTDFGFALFSALIVQAGVQAFLCGTFDKLQIKRNAKGKTEITKHWRFLFVPTPPQKIDWKVSHGTAIVATHNPGPLEWGVMLYLLCAGCLPGLIFYWFVIKPERYDVVLCDLHGSTDQAIFRTTNRDMADTICTTINETTGLAYRPVV